MELALSRLSSESAEIVNVSRMYRSQAVPPGSGPNFANAVARASTALSAHAFLDALHAIEAEFGRRRERRWGPRVVDLDLLDYGGRILPDAGTHLYWRSLSFDRQKLSAPTELVLPHPRLQDRPFVLLPLLDVDPGWRHPVTGQSVKRMLSAFPKREVARIAATAADIRLN